MAHYVAGHIVCGLGLITACVSTVATGATRSTLIPENSSSASRERQERAFSPQVSLAMIAVPVVCAAAGFVWAGVLLAGSGGSPEQFIAGHVLIGLSLICASLVALVASVVRQVANVYGSRERTIWPWTVITLGLVNLVWGLVLVVKASQAYWPAPGWVMIGLSLIQLSILSKVGLLALVWRSTFSLANLIPLIPVWSALITLRVRLLVPGRRVQPCGVHPGQGAGRPGSNLSSNMVSWPVTALSATRSSYRLCTPAGHRTAGRAAIRDIFNDDGCLAGTYPHDPDGSTSHPCRSRDAGRRSAGSQGA